MDLHPVGRVAVLVLQPVLVHGHELAEEHRLGRAPRREEEQGEEARGAPATTERLTATESPHSSSRMGKPPAASSIARSAMCVPGSTQCVRDRYPLENS